MDVPTTTIAMRLCVVLGVSPAFLARPWSTVELVEPFFRSRRSTPSRAQAQARAHACLLAEVLAEIECVIPVPAPDFGAELRCLAGSDMDADAERAASSLRRHWGLPAGPVDDVCATLESHGAVVTTVSHFDDRLGSFTLRTARRPVVVLCSESGAPSRRRFDAAHELAHIVMHDRPAKVNRQQEDEADRFAAAFLMPADTIGPWLIRSAAQLDRLERGAKTWGVSVQALARRSRDLGTLSEADYHRTMRRMESTGWRVSELIASGPAEYPRFLQRAASAVGLAGLSTVARDVGFPLYRLCHFLAPCGYRPAASAVALDH